MSVSPVRTCSRSLLFRAAYQKLTVNSVVPFVFAAELGLLMLGHYAVTRVLHGRSVRAGAAQAGQYSFVESTLRCCLASWCAARLSPSMSFIRLACALRESGAFEFNWNAYIRSFMVRELSFPHSYSVLESEMVCDFSQAIFIFSFTTLVTASLRYLQVIDRCLLLMDLLLC